MFPFKQTLAETPDGRPARTCRTPVLTAFREIPAIHVKAQLARFEGPKTVHLGLVAGNCCGAEEGAPQFRPPVWRVGGEEDTPAVMLPKVYLLVTFGVSPHAGWAVMVNELLRASPYC